MAKSTFNFLSADGKTQLHGVCWTPDTTEYRGILQITHGMVEYIERYQDFAEYLNAQGYLVVGHDHLGHGESVNTPEDWGFFTEKNGSDVLVEDMHTLRTMTQEKYPKLPYFMLGHSMGSFLLRKYICIHHHNLRGAIIMGTGYQPDGLLKFGKGLCKFLAKFHGWRYRSKFIQKLAFAGNDNKFRGENLKNSWLTRDVEIVKAYSKSPKCTFQFTLNGFYNLFDTIWYDNQKEHVADTPKHLPLFFVSGQEDPVGGFGKGVKRVYYTYEAAGMQDITWKLYPKDRHEILNELDRQQVYEDLYHWMEVRVTT